jgi:hypothetical protein
MKFSKWEIDYISGKFAMSTSSALPSSFVIVIILMLIIVARIRRVITGTKVSTARAFAYIAYYVGFAALILSGSYFEGVPAVYFAIYASILVVVAFVSFTIARGMLVFWRGPDGAIYSKGALPIYLTYVVGLILRISIGYIFVGPNFLYSTTPLTGAGLEATIITDVILVIGAGLLVGRNLRLVSRYRAIQSGKESLQETQDSNRSL